MPKGVYKLVYSSPGYTSVEKTITLDCGSIISDVTALKKILVFGPCEAETNYDGKIIRDAIVFETVTPNQQSTLDIKNWKLVSPKPDFSPREGHSIFTLNINGKQKVFLVAGEAGRDKFYKDVWSTTDGFNWKPENSNPSFPSRDTFTTFVLRVNGRDKVFLTGGINDGTNERFNDVWSSYDGVSWKPEANAPFSPRSGSSSVVFNGKAYIIGGWTDSNFAGDVWSFDGKTWNKENSAAIPARAYASSFIFNNKIFVVGGYTVISWSSNIFTSLDDVWSSSDGKTWKEESSTGVIPAYASTSFVWNNKAYILGGVAGTFPNYNFYSTIYSSNNGVNWNLETSSPGFSPRAYTSSFILNGLPFIVGGWYSEGFTNQVYTLSSPANVFRVKSKGFPNDAFQLTKPDGSKLNFGQIYLTNYYYAGLTPFAKDFFLKNQPKFSYVRDAGVAAGFHDTNPAFPLSFSIFEGSFSDYKWFYFDSVNQMNFDTPSITSVYDASTNEVFAKYLMPYSDYKLEFTYADANTRCFKLNVK